MSEKIETMDSGAEDFKGGELTHPNGSITRTFDTPKAYHQAIFDGWSEATARDAKAARKAGSAGAAVDGEAGGRDRKSAAAKAAATRKLNKQKADAEQSGDVTSTTAEVANTATPAA